MTPEQKKWIDGATYPELLDKWRFEPIGSVLFQGECGDYYKRVMRAKREALTDEEREGASKNIGWG